MKAIKFWNRKEAAFICLSHSGKVDRAHYPVPCLLVIFFFRHFLFLSFLFFCLFFDEGLVVVTTQINRDQVQLYF